MHRVKLMNTYWLRARRKQAQRIVFAALIQKGLTSEKHLYPIFDCLDG